VDRKTLSGSEIRRSRLRIGWSREQLGQQIGVDSDTISLWEQGSLAVSCPIVLEQVFRRYEPASRYASRDSVAEELLHDHTR
jgi:transcriptional regulator with XRE-family HTH domain